MQGQDCRMKRFATSNDVSGNFKARSTTYTIVEYLLILAMRAKSACGHRKCGMWQFIKVLANAIDSDVLHRFHFTHCSTEQNWHWKLVKLHLDSSANVCHRIWFVNRVPLFAQ